LDKDNKPITSNPSITGTDVNFTWRIKKLGYFLCSSDYTEFMFENDDVYIFGKLGSPKPWGPNGEGPAGW
jgi:hypothetical protein